MTEDTNRAEDPQKMPAGEASGRTGLYVFSGGWVAAFGALALFAAPNQQAAPIYLPASLETASPIQSPTAPAAESVDFIVRFNDIEDIQTCLDTFKNTPESARDTFTNWASDYESLDGMELKKTSYAGELILSWSVEGNQRPSRADIITKQQELLAMPEVKYADPDYTAHAGDTP
ncbi:MAG: hypothetical protein ABJG15_19280 [Hyphomonadaceae bacterium]